MNKKLSPAGFDEDKNPSKGGGEEIMDYKALSQEVGKSVSTLKRWKRKIEELSDYDFEESTVRIGRGRNYQKIPVFTSHEIEKFKELGLAIEDLGQDEAIRKVWGDKIPSQKALYLQVKNIARALTKHREDVKEQLSSLESENNFLRREIRNLKQEMDSLKESQYKKRRLFK